MQQDWKTSIVRMAYWKQLLNEHDKLGAFPWHLPKVAANEARIAEAEARLERPFPAAYREFLGLADGWKGFIVSTDLFGTDDFLDGRASEVRNRADVQEYISSLGVAEETVIPIGASGSDMDVFILVSENYPTHAGEVLWFAGSEVERYTDFREFFEAMVNYNAELAQRVAVGR
jgi:hypothetical protein